MTRPLGFAEFTDYRYTAPDGSDVPLGAVFYPVPGVERFRTAAFLEQLPLRFKNVTPRWASVGHYFRFVGGMLAQIHSRNVFQGSAHFFNNSVELIRMGTKTAINDIRFHDFDCTKFYGDNFDSRQFLARQAIDIENATTLFKYMHLPPTNSTRDRERTVRKVMVRHGCTEVEAHEIWETTQRLRGAYHALGEGPDGKGKTFLPLIPFVEGYLGGELGCINAEVLTQSDIWKSIYTFPDHLSMVLELAIQQGRPFIDYLDLMPQLFQLMARRTITQIDPLFVPKGLDGIQLSRLAGGPQAKDNSNGG